MNDGEVGGPGGPDGRKGEEDEDVGDGPDEAGALGGQHAGVSVAERGMEEGRRTHVAMRYTARAASHPISTPLATPAEPGSLYSRSAERKTPCPTAPAMARRNVRVWESAWAWWARISSE